MSILINGKLPANTTCPYSKICKEKTVVCNGQGCPVSDNKTIEDEFSCGLLRGLELIYNK